LSFQNLVDLLQGRLGFFAGPVRISLIVITDFAPW